MSDVVALGANGAEAPRRALVLAGGGLRVAWQAGVLRALADHGLSFAHADATSGGILNLAMLLSGIAPAEMTRRWQTLVPRAFASLLPLEEYLPPRWGMAVGDADGITGKVFPHLGIDAARIRAVRGLSGTFNVCDFARKTVVPVPHDRVTQGHLVAGISLPLFLPPVEIEGVPYTDAVWIKDANLLEAVRRGADELWLVWCIGNTPEYHRGAFQQYVHMIEMSANGALFEELDRIRELNERIAAGERVGGRTRPIRLHVIRPEAPLPLDPDYFFGRLPAASLVALGYADADRYLRNRPEQGLPFDPEVTRMTVPAPGIRFRETMKGPFAIDATDPADGAARGEQAATELAMHATVTVRDLDRFVQDPQHAGEIVGHIDFAPLGMNLPTGAGTFRLFAPANVAGTKLMVYELPFRADGVDYYLAGHKEVRDDRGADAWRDLTTLFTRLHRGTDASGPVVAAGVLRLSLGELKRLLGSVTTLDAAGAAEQAKLLAQFGTFFAGQVWQTYAGLADA